MKKLDLFTIFNSPNRRINSPIKLASTNDRHVFHLGDIYIENPENHSSNYEIKINDLHLFFIDLEHAFRHNQGTNLIRISLTYNENDQIDTSNTNVPDEDSLLLFDQEEINLPSTEKTSQTQFNTFAIHFQLPELILAFQTDLDLKPTKVCEAIFGQFQMSIEQKYPFCKTIALRRHSLYINDHLIKVDQCLFSTRCRKNSSINYFRNDHMISSSCPTDNYHTHNDYFSSLVPAYMVTNDSSTWTLTSSSPPPLRTASP